MTVVTVDTVEASVVVVGLFDVEEAAGLAAELQAAKLIAAMTPTAVVACSDTSSVWQPSTRRLHQASDETA